MKEYVEDEVMVMPETQSLHRIKTEESRSTFTEMVHAHDFSTLIELALDAPDVNHARVEQLKKEIAAGEYQYDSRRIAKQMLSTFA